MGLALFSGIILSFLLRSLGSRSKWPMPGCCEPRRKFSQAVQIIHSKLRDLMLKTYGLSLALLCNAVPALAVNVLDNPGFESGALAPWVNDADFCGGCTWTVDSADAHSGTYSAVVNGNRLIAQFGSPIPVSDITAISFWARHPDAAFGADMAVYFEYSDSSSEEPHVFTGDTTWTFFDVTAELDAGKSLAAFGVYGNTGTIARLDDALIDTLIPEPSTWLLLLTGSAWAVVRRRRQLA
jgi:hypothetical protein